MTSHLRRKKSIGPDRETRKTWPRLSGNEVRISRRVDISVLLRACREVPGGKWKKPPGISSGQFLRAPPGISSGHLQAFPPGTSGHIRAPPGTSRHSSGHLFRTFSPDIFSGTFEHYLWAKLNLSKLQKQFCSRWKKKIIKVQKKSLKKAYEM